jgi:integrase
MLKTLEDVSTDLPTAEAWQAYSQLASYAPNTIKRGALRAISFARGQSEYWQPSTPGAVRTLRNELKVGLLLQTLHRDASIRSWAEQQLLGLETLSFDRPGVMGGRGFVAGQKKRTPYRRLLRGLPHDWVERALYAVVTSRGDLHAALLVLALTGARPSEVSSAEFEYTSVGLNIKLNCAKRAVHMRQHDEILFRRVVPFRRDDGGPWVETLCSLLKFYPAATCPLAEVTPSRLAELCVRVGGSAFPKRKQALRASCFRNQLSADLKASGIERSVIAYMLGHDVRRTAGYYGTAKQAGTMSRSYLDIQALRELAEGHAEPTDPYSVPTEDRPGFAC